MITEDDVGAERTLGNRADPSNSQSEFCQRPDRRVLPGREDPADEHRA